MRKITLVFFIVFHFSLSTQAQDRMQLSDSTLFDFWVGEWNGSWKNPDGTISTGKNTIKKILDGKVLEENFRDTQGFKGTSISVYSSKEKMWHQAWADNQGGFFNFIGEVNGNKRIFRTPPKQQNGKQITQRMVFYDITSTSMTWDWELSNDGGKTWQLQWRIEYTKAAF